MGELAKFFVTVGSKYDPSGMNTLIKDIEAIEKKNENMFDGFKKVGAGLTAMAGVGVGALAYLGVQYAQSEEAEIALADAVKRHGLNVDETMKHLKEYANTVMLTTGYSDEEVKSLQTVLVNYGAHGEMLDKITMATIDLAKAKGMDLASAGQLIGRTLGSESDALKRYGIEVEGAQGSTKRMTSVTKELNEMFGGTAVARAQSLAGQFKIMRERVGELAEEAGKELVPTMNKLIGVTSSVITWFEKLSPSTKTAGVQVALMGTIVAGLAGPFFLLLGYIPSMVTGFGQMSTAVKAFGASFGPVSLAIIGITAVISGLILVTEAYVNSVNKHAEAENAVLKTYEGKLKGLQDYRKELLEQIKAHSDDAVKVAELKVQLESNSVAIAKMTAKVEEQKKAEAGLHAQRKTEAVEIATMSKEEIDLAMKKFTIEEEAGKKTLAQKLIFYTQLKAFAKTDSDQQLAIIKALGDAQRELQDKTVVGGWNNAVKEVLKVQLNWKDQYLGMANTMQSGMSQVFGQMLQGSMGLAQGINETFNVIKNSIIQKCAEILAQQAVQQVFQLIGKFGLGALGVVGAVAVGASMLFSDQSSTKSSGLTSNPREDDWNRRVREWNAKPAGDRGPYPQYAEGGMSLIRQIAQVDPNELHLPLDSPATVKALAGAMKQAGGGGGSAGGVTVGKIEVNIKADKLDQTNVGAIAQQIADEIKRKTPEALRLAKVAFKTGQAYNGEGV